MKLLWNWKMIFKKNLIFEYTFRSVFRHKTIHLQKWNTFRTHFTHFPENPLWIFEHIQWIAHVSNHVVHMRLHLILLYTHFTLSIITFPFRTHEKNSIDGRKCIRVGIDLTSDKTAEWHCMCRYVSWALVFY